MNKITLRIDKERHVYVPGHKLWVQMYKQLPTPTIMPSSEIIEDIVKEWDYDGKQIDYNKEWEGNTEIVEGEEVELTVEKYLYNNFDEVWDNN